MKNETSHLVSSVIDIVICYLEERDLGENKLITQLSQLAKAPRLSARDLSKALQEVHALDPVPALGLRIGLMAKPQHFGLVGYLLTSCSTLSQALIRYGRFQTLVLSDLKSVVKKEGNAVRYHWQLTAEKKPHAYEFSVAVFIKLYQNLIGKALAPARVGLPVPAPIDCHIYDVILGCPVEFNAPSLYVDVPSHLMLEKISTRDAYLLRILDEQAHALLGQNETKADSFEPFLEQLQKQLLVAMKDGDTRASTVANTMGLSLRSLYRKLSDNGHSYRTILADSRRRLAKQYLADLTLSPSEIALLLGYSEQSAFIRAFKEWTGQTPGEYRMTLALP